ESAAGGRLRVRSGSAGPGGRGGPFAPPPALLSAESQLTRVAAPPPSPNRGSVPARAGQAVLLATLAWGVLAFGGVYPWAYWPLAGAAIAAGALAVAARRGGASGGASLGLLPPAVLLFAPP